MTPDVGAASRRPVALESLLLLLNSSNRVLGMVLHVALEMSASGEVQLHATAALSIRRGSFQLERVAAVWK